MVYKEDNVEFYQNRAQKAKLLVDSMRNSRTENKLSLLFFSLKFIYFIPLFIVCACLGKQAKSWFIGHYFRRYFSSKGLYHYWGTEPPEHYGPTLFLTTRETDLKALFLFSILKPNIIIPLSGIMKKWPLFPAFLSPALGKWFKHISYPEQEYHNCHQRIDKLLKSGYSVLAYLNIGHTNTSLDNRLFIPKEIENLVSQKVPTVIISSLGFEQIETAHAFNPETVSFYAKPFSDILDSDKSVSYHKIAETFMYKYGHPL